MRGTDYEINNADILRFELRVKAANMKQKSLTIEFDGIVLAQPLFVAIGCHFTFEAEPRWIMVMTTENCW